jgi:hypothetical protein
MEFYDLYNNGIRIQKNIELSQNELDTLEVKHPNYDFIIQPQGEPK